MNVNQLRYFVAVAEELHFGRAAQKLGVAQPPLSQQIRRLEDDLGVQLLQRTKRRVQLTDAGRAFLEEARKTLSQLARAVEAAQGAGRGEVGRLAIGFFGAATYSLLPSTLVAFRNAFPKVEIELHELKTLELIQALREKRVQVGFVRMPVNEDILQVEPILSERLVVALPERHALAAKAQLCFRDLSEEIFLMPPRQLATAFYDQVLNLCTDAGFSPKLGAEASQLQTIINLVAAGMGITLVPESVATLASRGVVFKHLPDPSPMMEIAVAWRRDECAEVLAAFLKVVRQVARPTPG